MADEATTIPTGIQLTVFDEVFRNHPHERFDALRGAEPVHHDKVFNRYVLTRASDVAAVLKDRRLSRDPRKAAPDSATALVLGEARDDPSPSILFLDDPDHKRLRGLVTKAFNAHAIESMRGHIAEIADGLLDTLADKPEFDLIADFASPLPIIVIAEMLGIDPADRADFRRWSLGLNLGFSPSDQRRKSARSAGSMPSISAMTMIGSGEAKSAIRSNSGLSASVSSNPSAISAIWPRIDSMAWALNAFVTRPRSRL